MTRGGLAAVAAALAIAIGLAVPAHADQYDFIDVLDKNGVYYDSIGDVINQGKMVCRILRSGQTTRAAMDYIVGKLGYPERDGAYIVVAAYQNMCPDQEQRASAPDAASHY